MWYISLVLTENVCGTITRGSRKVVSDSYAYHITGGAGISNGFEPRSGHVGFVVDREALGQVSSKYFGFPRQFSLYRLLHTHHLSSGAGIIGQWPMYQMNSVSPHPKKLKKKTAYVKEGPGT
jgi:hypothetical protein